MLYLRFYIEEIFDLIQAKEPISFVPSIRIDFIVPDKATTVPKDIHGCLEITPRVDNAVVLAYTKDRTGTKRNYTMSRQKYITLNEIELISMVRSVYDNIFTSKYT